MEAFELFLSTPLHHYFAYVIITFIVFYVLRTILKDSFYFVVLLSTFILFAIFSKEVFTDLPLTTMDIQNLTGNTLGVISGVLIGVFEFSLKAKKQRRLN